MGVAQLFISSSRLPGRFLRCPHCDQRGAAVSLEHGRWRWHCRTCGHPREAARRARLRHDLTVLVATGHALRARCFANDDLRDLNHDFERWVQTHEGVLRKRLGAASGSRVRPASRSRSARYNADAALDASIAARTKALERILAEQKEEAAEVGIKPT